ncbi:hypothetical protein [Endozoicomonas sp. ONNA1]|uniref:hypothetical protein n=1 Tax=Endozoicomonas sp. ONNA1 TaxID=2828740 RepID=UPI0021481D41|nr:hypothetical protein [Endozoicomonas sp. ONNA1]
MIYNLNITRNLISRSNKDYWVNFYNRRISQGSIILLTYILLIAPLNYWLGGSWPLGTLVVAIGSGCLWWWLGEKSKRLAQYNLVVTKTRLNLLDIRKIKIVLLSCIRLEIIEFRYYYYPTKLFSYELKSELARCMRREDGLWIDEYSGELINSDLSEVLEEVYMEHLSVMKEDTIWCR